MSTQNSQQPQQEEQNKDAKKFAQNLKKLENLFNGDKKAFKRQKVKNDDLDDLAQEILAEERAEAIASFKSKTRVLLKKKSEFDKFVIQKTKELENAILEKKKEFSKEMEEMFQEIENVDALADSFANTFRELTETTTSDASSTNASTSQD